MHTHELQPSSLGKMVIARPLQAMHMHELQPLAKGDMDTVFNLQAMHTHELQQQKCTMHWLMHGLLCAYLNLFECLASPKEMGLTATFSISGREVAPDFCAKQQEKPVHSVFARVAFAIILSIPFVEIFREAFRSAFALKPQAVQQKRAWLGRFLASMFPHLLHRWEV